MELFEYLNNFHPITKEDFNLLCSELKPLTYKKGETIVAEGEIQKELYFVKSGLQMSFYESEKKIHVLAFTYGPGLCAIPDAFCLQTATDYSLCALSDSELDALSYTDLMRVFDASQNIERLFRKMTELILAGVIKRHLELHTLSMEERFIHFCQRSPHLLHVIPHKYIASYLDIDASNFSKLFNSVKI